MAKKGSKFKKYSLEFKLQVVQDYLSNKYGGVDAITKKHGLKSSRQVRDWLKLYEENPALLGQDKRGKKSTGRPKSFKLDEMTLEEQNEYLRMENDILKKYQALLKTLSER